LLVLDEVVWPEEDCLRMFGTIRGFSICLLGKEEWGGEESSMQTSSSSIAIVPEIEAVRAIVVLIWSLIGKYRPADPGQDSGWG